MPNIPSMEDMMKAGVHFGHRDSRWHPNMAPFIHTKRGGVHIINLEKTIEQLEKALRVVSEVSSRGGTILMLGTKAHMRPHVKVAADRAGAPYVYERWLGGTLTNFAEISKLIKRLRELKRRKETGDLRKYTKREQLMFDREVEELEEKIGGIAMLDAVPDMLVIFDMRNETTAIREANRKGIPMVGFCDTNVNPELVRYPVPANDDAVKSIIMMTELVADAILEGKKDAKPVKKAAVARKIAIK